jgi:hypothetical protein
MARHRWTWATPAAAGLLGIPFVLSQNSWFEWANALWLLQLQTAYVKTHGVPTFFINAPEQVFYPVHLFYAGSLFSVLAYPSTVFGAWPVFAATTILAFVALAAGVYWMARSLGVPGLYATAPALLFATTPYVVSDLYGRGAWTELVALAGVSVVLGSTTALLSGGPRRGVAFAALVVASFVVAGTHNITLLWSVIIGVPFLALIVAALGVGGADLVRRGGSALLAAALGAALCACFVVPNLALSHDTSVAQKIYELSLLRAVNNFETPAVVFSPLLSQPKTTPTDLHTQTAVVVLLWTVIVLVGFRSRVGRKTLILLAGTGLLTAAVTLLVVEPRWWSHLPSLFWATQFSFRLVPYLTLGLILAMILLLRAPTIRTSRWAITGLVLAVAWQGGLAGYQSVVAKGRSIPPYPPILVHQVTAAAVPNSFGGKGFGQPTQFRLVSGRRVTGSAGVAVAPVVRTKPPVDAVLSGHQAPGSLVSTNVVYSPLIAVRGEARLAGRDKSGLVVLSITGGGPDGWRATVIGACPLCLSGNRKVGYLPVEAGEALTVLGIAVLGALSVLVAGRSVLIGSGQHRARRRT